MKAFLQRLENLGILDLVGWVVILVLASISIVGLSVPVILDQPQWWRHQSVSTSIGVEMPTPVQVQIEAPYCLSDSILDWNGVYYVAHPGMYLPDDKVKEWYAPFFIDNLGYIPSDIRVISADPSTDSQHSHYIEAYRGFIVLDGIYCDE